MDEAALQGMLDRQAIVDCLHRYTRGMDRRDADLLRSAYHADAVEDHAGAYVGGVDGLIEYLFGVHERFAGYQRFLTNSTVDVVGDEAHVESYFLSVIHQGAAADGRVMLSGGRYLDRFERRSGEWRIAERTVVLEWHGSADGGTVPSPLVRLDRDDVSYQRPLTTRRR